jgi:transcriptional regulator GlxA family with amidase domain
MLMVRKTRQRHSREAERQRVERAIDLYLHACYGTDTPARSDECAAWMRVARPHLSRIAPVLLGMPLQKYLRSRQLAYAQQLLRTTPLSIEQIAIAAAFGTSWTFYRCFRAAFGMTPAAYRRQEGR